MPCRFGLINTLLHELSVNVVKSRFPGLEQNSGKYTKWLGQLGYGFYVHVMESSHAVSSIMFGTRTIVRFL